MNKFLLSLAACAFALPAMAHTDLLYQNFNAGTEKLYTTLELDHLAPAPGIAPAFQNGNGVAQPWWPVVDTKGSQEKFLGSHSYYTKPGTSNDWVTFTPVTIPTEGFNLTFGAQSAPVRSGDTHALSDLRVYITEKPVTEDWQPTEPTLFVENLGYGKSRDICEGDFLPFSINLDEYVGKTIYISFANLNTDKDILVIDDVLVRRLDLAEINVEAPQYILHGDFDVHATIKGTDGEGLSNWKLTFKCGDTVKEESGASLANGESKDFTFTANVGSNQTATYTLTLSSDGNQDIEYVGTTTGMMFQTTKRSVAEETTFTSCGNCPMAVSNFEAIEASEEYGELILPVSLHVDTTDPMHLADYTNMLGFGSVAPMVRVDRADEAIGFADADLAVDFNRENSAAYNIIAHLNEIALFDVNVSGTFLKNAGKVSGIDATAEFIPAVDIDGSKYQIGFILTENNVTKPEDASPSWNQHNYVFGNKTAQGAMNAWGFLPSNIKNMRYQDVARAIYDFHGLENSLPAKVLPAGEKVTFNTQLGIPELSNGRGTINPENLYLTVFVIEKDTQLPKILNANRVALGENPTPRVTGWDMAKELGIDPSGIDDIVSDSFDGEAEYFNLQGMRVLEPAAGIYIVRRGDKVTKEVVK